MPKPCPYFTGWSPSFREHHRVLHTLDVAVDNGLPGTSGWRGPIEITCDGSVAMPSFPIHYKCMGGWFVLKSIAHGSKCPIELCLPIDVGRKFSWLLKTCSEFSLHLRDAAKKSFKLYMFTCKRQAWGLSRQSTSISLIIYQHFPSRNLCDFTGSCC